MLGNARYSVEVWAMDLLGRKVSYRSITLNDIFTVTFLELDELESSRLDSVSEEMLNRLPYGFLVLPANQREISYIAKSTTDPQTLETFVTHAFLIPREMHVFFQGELNALDLVTKPDGYGIDDIDRLSVIQFIFTQIVEAGLLSPYQLKALSDLKTPKPE
ncbi:hypothetical protein GCM10008959_40260 [Deinococcus seoulensis]|uniref:Uncharacterized protein n=2 Tax=Deinococcus seoulensis TaxID=1837379 RepID=A0ABQ2S049_9DEIO|nr:hypothetical protein GCM10008959_40260 [Deinococcus seoulensis]